MNSWQQNVFPHGSPVLLAPGLWQVTGSLPRMPLPRNMVVYKLNDGTLFIHSAIALNEEGMTWLEQQGRPAILLVPNGWHRFDAARYKERYSEMRVICPSVSKAKVEEMVKVDAVAEEALSAYGITCHIPPGRKVNELVYELPLEGGRALVACDLLFNLEHLPGFSGLMMRIMGSTGFFGITRVGRLMGVERPAETRGFLERLAALPDLRAISVAHGSAITDGCSQRLMEAAARL